MRAWLHLVVGLVGALALASTAPAAAWAATPSANVGFETLKIADPDGAPEEIGIWYPTDLAASSQPLGGWRQTVAPDAPAAEGGHPLVVMSHGNGGWYAGHYDTALALAHAGFVVAALTHPGDNYQDQSHAADVSRRSIQLKGLTDFMLDQWRARESIDPAKIGVFGFSAGGFTALVTIGGVPDLSGFPAHCQAHPGYYDCGVVRRSGKSIDAIAAAQPSVWVHDPRIKAAVVAAPALGFAFAPDGLKGVTVPVQLWRAEYDHILPQPDYAEAARAALPTQPEYYVVPGADHFDFLAPCNPDLAAHVPMICSSRPGFDRPAFHEAFDKAVVAFFVKTIG